MSLKLAGNLSWVRQVSGAGRPVPDSNYRLARLPETWVGRTSQMDAFLLTKPMGSSHPEFPWMRLSEYRPERLEAGMHQLELTYVGRHGSDPTPQPHPRKMLRVDVKQAKYQKSVGNYGAPIPTGYGSYTPLNTQLIECPAEIEWSVYIPTVTYRYARYGHPSSPQYSARALIDLAGQTPEIRDKRVRRTGTYPVGLYDYVGPETFVSPVVVGAGANLRATELTADPIGESGWYQIDETHEYSFEG